MIPDGIRIRPARSDERDAVLDLWRRAETLPTHTDDADSIARVIAAPHATLLLAEDSHGALVGSLIAGWDGWRGTLYRLAVAPEHRRRGLGRALVEAALDWHRAQGARRVITFTKLHEPHAIGFWRSLRDLGFEEPEGDARFVNNF